MRILVVDDQRSARRVLRGMLASLDGIEVCEASSAQEALDEVERQPPDLLLLDVRLSEDPRDRGGLAVLRGLRAAGNQTPAVMVTALTEVAEIREAMRSGAQDYVFKDELSPEMILPIVEAQREKLMLRGEVNALRERVERNFGVSAILGSSSEMQRVREVVMRVADATSSVLLRGETGTGKEMVARALHEVSCRSREPFVAVNCSTLPGSLVESLLFGHERGAFTGAEQRVRGQLERAGEGTLLLDEIADMPSELQSKLLRVLEERRFLPLGADTEVPLRARVVAATHANLEARIASGRFREDLFFRLNVLTISLPALSQRVGDIPELLDAFASGFPRRVRFTDDALTWLMSQPWHGNVRELKNLVERVVLLADGDTIDAGTLQRIAGSDAMPSAAAEIDRIARALLSLPGRLGSKLDVIERAVLHHAIESCGGNKSAAARLVGVHRKALLRRWEKLSDPPGSDDEDE